MAELPVREVRHVILVLEAVYNPMVEKWFKVAASLGTKRGNLKTASLIKKDDSLLLILVRLFIFYFVVGYFKQGLATFYGSKFDKETDAAKHPQLFLYFSQDAAAVPDDTSKIDKEKSVRLTKLDQSITPTQLVELAREVKAAFTTSGKGWTYTTGKISVSYLDPDHGFYRGNYVLVANKTDGIELYKKLCNLIDVPFNIKNITVADPEKQNVGVSTTTVTIAGKKYKTKRYRPVGVVRFRYAYVSFGNNIPPMFLVDLTGKNFTVQEPR